MTSVLIQNPVLVLFKKYLGKRPLFQKIENQIIVKVINSTEQRG